jgi:eukaryotic-like serine/threonine-protein kinase
MSSSCVVTAIASVDTEAPLYGIGRLPEDPSGRRRKGWDVSSPAFVLPDRELVLDRYRPLRPLGRGGSGSVWLARDERTGLDVALKIVPREGKRAPRAAREAEAASRLRHPRCVRAYDFGGDAGHVYIAYEYVQGRTLREALRTATLGERQIVETAAQVLEGLAHAHAKGIIHRDVKPANVLLEESADVSVRLLDFGLAQFDEADTLTAVGDVPGTLAYIAPERLNGGDASAASDVWAVGVLLWEALVGTHPFWGVPLPDVAKTIEAGPPPLSKRRPDLPRPLVAAVDRALHTTPARRPAAGKLAAELRAALAAPRRERPQRKRPPRPATRRTAPLEARLAPAAACGIAAAAGGALLPFWPPVLLAGLALAAAGASLRSPRIGLALALAAPVFPFGNVALGAALLYVALAVGWLALTWRDARAGLAFCAGPLLAPIGALALLPVVAQPARGWVRRAAHAGVAVLAAALVAGLRDRPLPLTGDKVGDLGVAASEQPSEVGAALLDVLASNPALVTTAIALGAAAALLPTARAFGPWGIAGLGAGQLVVILLAAPSISWVPVVLGTCALYGALALAGEALARKGAG